MTALSAGAPTARQFTISGVLQTSVGVLAYNALLFGPVILVLALPDVIFIARYGDGPSFRTAGGGFDPVEALAALALLLAMFVCGFLRLIMLTYATFQTLRGETVAIGDCLRRGFAVLLPVLIGMVICVVLIGLASVLLLVPGIVVALSLWVYTPAIVIERRGIFEAFTRSRELTQGRRWSIFGAMLVAALVVVALVIVEKLVFRSAAIGGGNYVELALQLLFSAFWAILAAVSYYYLRAEKEGIAVDELAKVFD